jgi:hypothetical protein
MLRNIAKIAKFPTLSSNVINVAARSVTFGKAAKLEAPAPKFEGVAALPDLTLKKISLDDYKGKYLVFFWYPKDFTFGTFLSICCPPKSPSRVSLFLSALLLCRPRLAPRFSLPDRDHRVLRARRRVPRHQL